jgi:hypothetical protein
MKAVFFSLSLIAMLLCQPLTAQDNPLGQPLLDADGNR